MTATGIAGGILVLAGGLWLVVRRDRWARDLYQLPDNRVGRAIVAMLGVLLIVAVVWSVADALAGG